MIAKTGTSGDGDSLNSASGGGGSTRAAPMAPPMGPTVSSLVAEKQSQLKACLGTHKDEIRLILTVTAGKTDVKFASKTAVSAQLEACMKKVINSITFKSDGAVSTTVKP
jgi:hypothetical protein